jgi:hypothetical protein
MTESQKLMASPSSRTFATSSTRVPPSAIEMRHDLECFEQVLTDRLTRAEIRGYARDIRSFVEVIIEEKKSCG